MELTKRINLSSVLTFTTSFGLDVGIYSMDSKIKEELIHSGWEIVSCLLYIPSICLIMTGIQTDRIDRDIDKGGAFVGLIYNKSVEF